MNERRDDLVYRRINQLTAMQIAAASIVLLIVGIVAILQNAQLKETARLAAGLEARISALEEQAHAASPLDAHTEVRERNESPEVPRRAEHAAPEDPPAAELAERMTRLAANLTAPLDESAKRDVASVLARFTALLENGIGADPAMLASAARLAAIGGDVERAVAWGEDALAGGADPTRLAPTFARSYHQLGRHAEALPHATFAASADNRTAADLMLLASVQSALGHKSDAEKTLVEAIVFDAVAVEAAVLLARQLIEQGAFSRAESVIERGREIDADTPALRRLLVEVLFAGAEYERCAEVGVDLVEQDLADMATLRLLGRAQLELKRSAEAAETFRKLCENAPNDAEAFDLRGLALLGALDAAGAVEQFYRSIELDPSRAATSYHLGVALANTDDCSGAIKAYRAAIELDPDRPAVHFAQAVCFARTEQTAEAEAALERAVSLDDEWLEQADRVKVFARILPKIRKRALGNRG